MNNLKVIVHIYSVATGLKESTIGKKFAGDGRFFSNIQSSMTFTVRKYDLVISRFSSHWPEGAEWPSEIERPKAIPAKEQANAQ